MGHFNTMREREEGGGAFHGKDFRKVYLLDVREVLEGPDWLLGGAEAAVGFGEGEVVVRREPVRLLHHRPPLLQEEAREGLILRVMHLELLRHRQRFLWFLRRRPHRDRSGIGARQWRRIAGLGMRESVREARVWGFGAGRRKSPPLRGDSRGFGVFRFWKF